MKRLLLTVISLSVLTGLSAQTNNADAILEKTARIYAEWGGMEVKFTAQTPSAGNGLPEELEGTIRMKANKFVLATPEMTTWFDGTTQWTYWASNDEVNIMTPSGDDLRLMNPMMLLQDYKKDFNVTLTGESTSANCKTAYDIALTPKKKNNIEKIELQIEKSTSLPVKLVVAMRNNQRNIVIVNEMKAGNPPDDIFSFPKASYPDAEIIDLR